jgi:hypothetical protein
MYRSMSIIIEAGSPSYAVGISGGAEHAHPHHMLSVDVRVWRKVFPEPTRLDARLPRIVVGLCASGHSYSKLDALSTTTSCRRIPAYDDHDSPMICQHQGCHDGCFVFSTFRPG